ncbi:MAG: hypothetical protein ABW352_13155 [Polyangiales bacterium]
MQTSTLRHIVTFAFVVACSDSDDGKPMADACSQHSDCVLVTPECCNCPPTTLASVRAAHRDGADAPRCDGIACAPCAEVGYDPLRPQPRAACIAKQCQVIDLRQDEASRCAQDSDCRTESAGCCPGCTSDPQLYVSLNTQTDRGLLACFPVPPCDPCLGTPPSSYCAADGHCAVRK